MLTASDFLRDVFLFYHMNVVFYFIEPPVPFFLDIFHYSLFLGIFFFLYLQRNQEAVRITR